jgi:hypothetical protein
MAFQIQLRSDTAAVWTATNPVLAMAEVGLETDTALIKFGNGITAWASLPYVTGVTNIDGGSSTTTYLTTQALDGGHS